MSLLWLWLKKTLISPNSLMRARCAHPRYRRIQKLPFIPTEGELDQLMASSGKKTGTFLQLLKETGMRAGEAWKLWLKDVDFINFNVRVTLKRVVVQGC